MSADYERRYGAFFDKLADAARETALLYFRKNLVVDEKDDKSPVTQADREIEQTLRRIVKQTYPDHGIIGEEFGRENADAEYVWVIDPIDGTKAFATGRPSFGTIIGLAHKGKPVVGLVDQAYTKERWFAVGGQFCRHNGAPVRVAPPRKLTAARFYSTTPAMFEGGYEENFEALRKSVKWPQYSADCYAYGLLAMGWVDLVIERQLKVHDVIGLVPLVTGGGGYACDFNGREIDINSDGTMIAASSKELADEARDVISRGKALSSTVGSEAWNSRDLKSRPH